MSTSSAKDLDDALAIIARSTKERKAVSVALLGNAAEVLPELVRRGVRPDIVTDQTSAHDPVNGYLPKGWTLEQWEERREGDPKGVERAAKASMAEHVRAMLAFHNAGVPTVDYGNNIRQMALEEGVEDAFDFPGFVPAYIRPLFCRGVGPFRWAALSGDPEDIFRTDAKVKELMPGDAASPQLARHGAPAHSLPGSAGAHLLGRPRRPAPARARLQRDGRLGRTQGADRHRPRSSRFRLGRLAQPRNGSDEGRLGRRLRLAHAQCALNCASGATWVSLHHGGGVGMGYSQHAGMVVVCDGTAEAARRIERVLVERSGERRHAPRRRRLRGGDRMRAGEGARSAEPGGVIQRLLCDFSPNATEELERCGQ